MDNPGVPATSSVPRSPMVSPPNQSIVAMPLWSGSLFANSNCLAFLSKILGTKEEEEDGGGNHLEKERWVKPPCNEAKDKFVTWLSSVCAIAICEYWKARKESFWLGQCLTADK